MTVTPIAPPAPADRKPQFENMLKVLRREVPDRPVLFELFLNNTLYNGLTAHISYEGDPDSLLTHNKRRIDACALCGYDYATVAASRFEFPVRDTHQGTKKSYSLNETTWISSWQDFESYPWPDPDDFDPSDNLTALDQYLPEGMKVMIIGPCGVLENSIRLMGYENLCALLYEEPQLVEAVFEQVGRRIERYYQAVLPFNAVGALILNDDWGFNTQPMLSPQDMRRFVFPWYKKITAKAHENGKPVVLHSCGNPKMIMSDIIDDMCIDGRHSYEDTICPVEDFYEEWNGKIAVIGGIDVNFLTTRSPEEVRARAAALIERTAGRGGYALGSGNSIPYYVPIENYFAMISAAFV